MALCEVLLKWKLLLTDYMTTVCIKDVTTVQYVIPPQWVVWCDGTRGGQLAPCIEKMGKKNSQKYDFILVSS